MADLHAWTPSPARPRSRTLTFRAGLLGSLARTSAARPSIRRIEVSGDWVYTTVVTGRERATYLWNRTVTAFTVEVHGSLTVDSGTTHDEFSIRALTRASRRELALVLAD